MARRRTFPRHWEKNPGVYARTTDTWTSRYYQRKQDPIFDMLGLNTAPDDYHKKDGSSPFLTNVRYMGEREEGQRAQVMSRKGAKLVATLGEDEFIPNEALGTTYLEVYEGKAIEWEISHSRLLTGIIFYAQNPDRNMGCLKITVRHIDTKVELANAVIDANNMSTNAYDLLKLRFINAVPDTRVFIRAEVLDDVMAGEEEDPRRSIRLLANSDGVHNAAVYSLPNDDDALKEIPYDFIEAPVRPISGTLLNDWESMPRSEEFRYNGEKYIAFPVRHDGLVELYRTKISSGETTLLTTNVDSRATAVRFAQAEGFLYYVDGWSVLKRINLTTLVVTAVVPLAAEITIPNVNPTTLTAKAGASLIHLLNNRFYLSGFKDDPNLVIMSLIDDVKPRFEQYNDRFYSPDQSPELSTGSPITALVDINGYLIVWRADGLSMYDRGGSAILADASQVTPEGSQLGVLNQEAVCKAKNNIYFYNPVEGLTRFAGSVNRNVSKDVENLMDRIKFKDKVFLVYQNEAVRMYFSFTKNKPDSCLYYYSALEGQLPWYLDINTPIGSAIALSDSDALYAVHSQTATIMQTDEKFTDFDSGIWLEYHTQYRIPATTDINGFSIVRRIHLHELASVTHSVYFGLDIDYQDKPDVWRRLVEAQVDDEVNPDAVFQHTAEPGMEVISIPMYVRCRKYQIRLRRFCWRDSGEILGVGVEYGDIKPI